MALLRKRYLTKNIKKAPKAERTSHIKALQREFAKHVHASARPRCVGGDSTLRDEQKTMSNR